MMLLMLAYTPSRHPEQISRDAVKDAAVLMVITVGFEGCCRMMLVMLVSTPSRHPEETNRDSAKDGEGCSSSDGERWWF